MAERTREIIRRGEYSVDGESIPIGEAIQASKNATRLIRPADWKSIEAMAVARCLGRNCKPRVVAETTLQAIERLAGEGHARIAVLNFASARRPGGGWDTGALAQEETLARASGLIAALEAAPGYYSANRQEPHLFYTDHAIWSPRVPFFARDDGTLLQKPIMAGVITMPAPNIGAMFRPTEADLRALPQVWRRRIRAVMALAIVEQATHLILGAWGCGAFGNDPVLVARCFRDELTEGPWCRGLETVDLSIFDSSRSQSCMRAFVDNFTVNKEIS